MGLTVIVNMLTVAHKGSNGTSISFPDVCKTPTPAGPIPIPYPNIAKSSDVASGSSTVKMDGGMILIKSGNMMISTGDEAGSAMGVVSNKIKGKAEFVNYSFDVKVDGKNVSRLTDPAQSNMGSANSIAPALVQAPQFAGTPQLEACKRVREQEDRDKNPAGKNTDWSESGVWPPHKRAFCEGAKDHNVVIFLRRTSKYSTHWIGKKLQPKPHSIINGNTLTDQKPANVDRFLSWLDLYWEDAPAAGLWKMKRLRFKLCQPPVPKREDYKSFFGIVIDNDTGEPYLGTGRYMRKWVTADYDLMDVVVHNDPDCRRLTASEWRRLMHTLNKKMRWDGIQHPPQAYWCSKPEDIKKGADKFSLPRELRDYLTQCAKGRKPDKIPKVVIASGTPPREMKILDDKCNVIAPEGHVVKTDGNETINAMICCGCHHVEASWAHDEKSGFRSEG